MKAGYLRRLSIHEGAAAPDGFVSETVKQDVASDKTGNCDIKPS